MIKAILITLIIISILVLFNILHEEIHIKINEYFDVRSEMAFDIKTMRFYTKINQYDMKSLSECERSMLMALHSINEMFLIFIPFFIFVILILILIYVDKSD